MHGAGGVQVCVLQLQLNMREPPECAMVAFLVYADPPPRVLSMTRDCIAGHTTQEEDVISGWLLAHAGSNPADQSALFKATVAGKWGMENAETGSRRTWCGVVWCGVGVVVCAQHDLSVRVCIYIQVCTFTFHADVVVRHQARDQLPGDG